jgi:D-glycero-D-manno-heptose 1,7-bisphosphate phosphatase
VRRRATPRRAVFLDRDGVLVREVDYLRDPSQLSVIPGVPKALKSLREAGFKLIVVTNQSGVARGYFSLTMLAKIHRELKHRLAKSGAKWDALYFSPHAGDSTHPWRKPGTGMLKAGEKRYGLDLKSSYMIGDKTADTLAGNRAGCTSIIVRTGYGGRDGKYPKAKPEKVCRDLAAAARWIISRPSRKSV